jgi:integrase/recombinase XerD
MRSSALDAGCRVSEVSGIRLQDIDWQSSTILLVGNGDKEREIPFGKSVKRALSRYLERRGDVEGVDYVFINQFGEPTTRYAIGTALHNYGVLAGMDDVRCSPHTCRHTFAKNWILNGGDAFTLQRILGHTTMEMVRRYVDMATEDLSRQHQKFTPMDNLSGVKKAGRKKMLR